jgi:hypothetical protein
MTDLFSIGFGRKLLGRYWCESRDGDDGARAIYDRHYSRYHYVDGRKPKLFVGPGEKLVMVTETGDALFVWRKFIDASGQHGVNNAVFRNESAVISSLLILDAEEIAHRRWPGERLYTYVDPRRIRSTNPGACFKKAGWKVCGITKWKKLIILEKPWVLPPGPATLLVGPKFSKP